MDWYYQLNGGREGPVDEPTLLKMFEDRRITEASLVWHSSFGDSWKSLDQAGLSLPAKSIHVPPPLPPTLPPTLPNTNSMTSNLQFSDFLASPITQKIVDKQFQTYQRKWQSIYTRSAGDLDASYKKVSWNWAAFIFNSGWFFYRKLYGAGAALFIVQGLMFTVFKDLPIYWVVWIACGLSGNSLYLKKVVELYISVEKIPNPEEREHLIQQQGKTSLTYCILASVALMGVATFT